MVDELGYHQLEVNFWKQVDLTRFTDSNQETGKMEDLNLRAELLPSILHVIINFLLISDLLWQPFKYYLHTRTLSL